LNAKTLHDEQRNTGSRLIPLNLAGYQKSLESRLESLKTVTKSTSYQDIGDSFVPEEFEQAVETLSLIALDNKIKGLAIQLQKGSWFLKLTS
jgi:hypothetical protein